MDIVLGVSMAPATIRMVLVEGQNADGFTVDEDRFAVDDADDPATLSAADQVIAAILGTREGAGHGGHQLTSTGVTWTDPSEAAALATALAARKVENVMLVSAFLAAAALAHTVGAAIGHRHTAMLFVEPHTATLALVDSGDGSITDVHRRPLHSANPVPELLAMIAGLGSADTYADGLFIVGCDVDIVPIKPALEAMSYLPVSAPEEPDMALARGAALASANAPLFASSTAALAYAQDPGTGVVDRYAVLPGYLEVPVYRTGGTLRAEDLAYSAAPDQEADAETGGVAITDASEDDVDAGQRRKPLMLVGSALAVVVVSAVLALEVALALGIRPAVALRPTPGQALIAPAQSASLPPVAQAFPAPHRLPIHVAPPLHLPAPAPIAPPVPVHAPMAAAPVPVPVPVPIHVGIPAPSVHAPLGPPRMNLTNPRPLLRPPSLPAMSEPGPRLIQQFPQPAMNFPGSQVPRFPMMPGREGPQFPIMPGSQAPRFPLLPGSQGPRFPLLPGSQAPRFPGLPGPVMPRMPGPLFPRMPGPTMPGSMMPGLPHFNFPGQSFGH